MCGIVGAVSAGRIERQIIVAMRDRLAHRGPDHAGLWCSDDLGVCLGHRRLSIIDPTPEANQPFVSRDGRFTITFNGEIYNFRALREELRSRGVSFRTDSDTEVLVEAFRCWGEKCLERLSGMFALGLWDSMERKLFCARDRAGEKPFYYALAGDSFVFASEVKSLLLWPGIRRRIDYPALVDYLSFGFVPDPKCIWAGIHKLPPGHFMSVEMPPGAEPIVRDPTAYWDMEFEPDHSVRDWGPSLLTTLQTAAQEMLVADVPIGAFLSGGVDSSGLTAALSRAGVRVNTFTVGFREHDYDERRWAREVAQAYGTHHTERVVGVEDVAPVFRRLLWHYDEPFADYSYLPTFYLCREARAAITVALSGDGGDEVFAGYVKYRRIGMRQDAERLLSAPLVRLMTTAAAPLFSETSRFRRTLAEYSLAPAPAMVDMLTLGLSLPMLRKSARGPLAEALRHYAPADAIEPLLRKAPPEQIGLVNAMRYLDLKLTLGAGILVKVDRASMAVSLEVRPVYLHRDLLALAGRIPADRLADRHESKRALKAALRAWLPDSVLYRPKMGFALPLKEWIRDDRQRLFQAARGHEMLGELMDTRRLDELSVGHSSRGADMTSQIHLLWFLEHWLETWAPES